MVRKLIGALVLGLGGCAILVALGVWQVQRLHWKEGILAEIQSRIAAAPVALPAAPDPEEDRYLPVRVAGDYTGQELHVLTSNREDGAGYRVIAGFQTDAGRRIMVDRGFIPQADKDAPRPAGPAEVTGNLHWPDETDSFTPAPELDRNIWFARDVPKMAEALGTEPLLVVARSDTGQGIRALPVGTEGIPNDHLQYAITWFSLAAIWAGMTLLLLWRIRRRDEGRA